MDNMVNTYLHDPTIGKLVAAVVGALVIVAVVRFLRRELGGGLQKKKIYERRAVHPHPR
jgi:hypothetical protein